MSIERKPFIKSLSRGPRFLSEIAAPNGHDAAIMIPAEKPVITALHAEDIGRKENGHKTNLNPNHAGSGPRRDLQIFPVPQD